jgi:FtsP/CotA-like multicopper oxidase with cupredoxin domain
MITVAAAVVPITAVSAASPPATAVGAASPPATAQQEAGMTPGLPLADPVSLNMATPRTLRLRLVAEPKQFDISGKKVWGESYDGDYAGPTLHFVPGEHVDLTLVNKLPTATDLHFPRRCTSFPASTST